MCVCAGELPVEGFMCVCVGEPPVEGFCLLTKQHFNRVEPSMHSNMSLCPHLSLGIF